MRRAITSLICGTALSFCFGVSRAAEPATTQSAGRMIEIKVIDGKTRSPLAGVTLKSDTSSSGPEVEDKKTTDASGAASLRLPEKEITYSYITARKPGYVPMRLMWRKQGTRNPEIPASYSLTMQPGTTLSGSVIDETGKRVAGATVVLAIRNDKEKRGSVEASDVSYVSVKAGDDGKWSYKQAPEHFEKIDIGAWHHDCDITQGFFPMGDYQQPLSTLRDGSAVINLTRGNAVSGTVFGSGGKPIAKASVGVGNDRVASNVIPAVKTDENGHYTFGARTGANVVVTFRAPGHAPELKEFVMADKAQTLDIHLQPARTLEGRIIDEEGKPIPGVAVFTDTWRGHRTIGTSLRTDKDGHFIWKEAPADDVMVDLYKSGYADDRRHPMSAAGREPIVVTLHKPLHVAGRVIDAVTSQPVAKFTVIRGLTWDEGKRISWERHGVGMEPLSVNTPGKFEFEESNRYPGYALRVEAEGYEPADSRVYTMDERNVELTFQLAKGQPFAGVILTPDGKPAGKANIQLATKDSQAQLNNGRPTPYAHENITADTDADGKFTLPPSKDEFVLLVVHDSGQARMSKEQWKSANWQINLEPWARVEGAVKIGARPGVNEAVSLYMQEEFKENAPRIYLQNETRTDPAGRFVFDRVFPGKAGVQRRIQLGANMWGAAVHKPIVAEAGKTVQVTLGGSGRPVVGRVALPSDMPEKWVVMQTSISSNMKFDKPPTPANFDDMSLEEKQRWYADWQRSDEGKAFTERQQKQMASRRDYGFRMAQDGSFRVEDVEPGSYVVNVQIANPPVGSTCGWGDPIGSASAEFSIPEIAGGRSDEPFELPSVAFRVQKTIKIGDAAPDFAVKTLDGKDLKLADFKGKYVLLDFWATWCGPCVAETPNLKAVCDAFGSDPRFAMISLSLDEKPEAPQKFAQKQGMKWHQGFLGEWSKATLPNDYGVHGIPSVWLIGPDGKVLAKDLRGAVMNSEIDKLLPK